MEMVSSSREEDDGRDMMEASKDDSMETVILPLCLLRSNLKER